MKTNISKTSLVLVYGLIAAVAAAGIFSISVLFSSSVSAQSSCSSLPDSLGKITLSASSVSSGTYSVWTRAKSPDGNPTFDMSIDGSGGSLCDQSVSSNGSNNAWVWSEHSAQLNWSGGSLSMQISGNKAGVGLDCVVLTTDSSFNPTTKEDCVAPDNEAPTVSVTSPANNATVSGNVTLSANASDNTGVTEVSFMVNGNTVLTDTTAPFSGTWNSEAMANGTYPLTATARDAAGNETTSAPRQITVDNSINGPTTTIGNTADTITVDGSASESVWQSASESTLDNTIVGSAPASSDLSATYKAVWTDQSLYVLVPVTDDASRNDSTNPWDDDSVEVYIETLNGKNTSPGSDYFQYVIRRETLQVSELQQNATAGVNAQQSATSNGYVMEIQIPWSTLQYAPAEARNIGFDVHVNDDDDGGGRDGKISWAATTDTAWNNPSIIGTASLTGSGGGGPGDPSITITTPDNSLVQSDTVPIQVSASDNGGIQRVDFYVDGSQIGTSSASPYTFNWDVFAGTTTNGNYIVTATAVDNENNSTTSDPITLRVRHPDVNRSGGINVIDLSAMLFRWGTASSEYDLNGNGTVDLFDLSLMLFLWDG